MAHLAKTAIPVAQALLVPLASPELLATMALLAKTESVTLVHPDLKEKLESPVIQVCCF